ncbi:hypothetical protein RchiOBHm_Chr2g0122301 [Rosa chinensis]|uniref:Uncharacterized protein n=1 Tax=Rosa chinensis TaxID=74649 RepID=A0A2P6RSU3_ROSCH|nr:hypothetical protein RchiOBHm_Chr2g0122301 [Rosa chinensis]
MEIHSKIWIRFGRDLSAKEEVTYYDYLTLRHGFKNHSLTCTKPLVRLKLKFYCL